MFFLLLLSSGAFAQDFQFDKDSGKAVPNYICQVKAFRGKVFRVFQGKSIPVEHGMRFYQNDTLITKDKSFVKLLVVDDSIVNLSSNSELRFENFKFSSKTDRSIVYNFLKGQIRALIKNNAKEGDIAFKTKLAIMGIRGTELLINHASSNQYEISEFALLSGKAHVMEQGNNRPEVISLGDKITVIQNSTNKETASERTVLEKNIINGLADPDSFLPHLLISQLSKNSSLYSFANTDSKSEGPQTEGAGNSSDTDQKGNWKENLRKLNEKLRENNRR